MIGRNILENQNLSTKLLQLLSSLVFMAASFSASLSQASNLAENDSTEYSIVAPEPATEVDRFAVRELVDCLKSATGVEFKTISATEITAASSCIFIGRSEPALKILGEDPLKGMEDQEYRVRTIGRNLFLYGRGAHGNLYAVYDFLENNVGWRNFSAFEEPSVPPQSRLLLMPIDRGGRMAFKYRYTSGSIVWPQAPLFLYRNRLNCGLKNAGADETLTEYIRVMRPSCHTLFAYVPPYEKPHPGSSPPMDWLVKKDYYKTNPEFFSQNASGKRTDTMQLCLSNTELRRTLSANVEEHVRRSGGQGVFTVDCNDVPGRLCCCAECAKLEEKYGTIAGPLIDYLLELAAGLRERYPEAMVKFLAYRKEQSQRPPKIDRLPDNLVVVFAPIDDNFAADWNHPSNAETYRDLQQWCRISRNVWVWFYTNPYVAGYIPPPFGNIEWLVNDIRLMKAAGCNGTYFQHDVGVAEGLGFSELQTYLILKLYQEPLADTDGLIREFSDHFYGRAGSLFRAYLTELEVCRKAIPYPLTAYPKPAMLRYLNPENLRRWEKYFDEMEKLTMDSPAQLSRIRLLRVSLDMSVLRCWREVHQAYPNDFPSLDALAVRIRSAFGEALEKHVKPKPPHYRQQMLARFEKEMESVLNLATVTVKPLPEPFNQIGESRISQAFPTGATVKDPDAALGIARIWEKVELPFTTGLYDQGARRWLYPRSIRPEEIIPDRYHFYHWGRIKLTTDCLVWCGQAWKITLPLEQFYAVGYPDIEWDAYLSLKFEGEGYSPNSKSKQDRVSCDRVVLVRVGGDY